MTSNGPRAFTGRRASAPRVLSRVAVASSIATLASLLPYSETFRVPYHPGDFGLAWFGATALVNGANPYALVGPGQVYDFPWPEAYPVTAMLVAMPFALLPQVLATLAFVWISTALLAYAITYDGWYRLPLFLSSAFVVAATYAQWSPLLTAAMCLPWLAWICVAKPNLGLAILAYITQVRAFKAVFLGGAAIVVIGFAVFPAWPLHWINALKSINHMHAPILLPGGVLVLFALLRWRRPEARLIVALACVPQTNSWYEALPLLLVPATFRQSVMLSVVSTAGGALWQVLFLRQFMAGHNEEEVNRITGILMIVFVYLPATVLVLRRSNEGKLPPFLDRVVTRRRAQSVIVGDELPATRITL